MIHQHICGDVSSKGEGTWRWDETKGCGRVWSHDSAVINRLADAPAILAHMCPSCGRGPWTSALVGALGMQVRDITQ